MRVTLAIGLIGLAVVTAGCADAAPPSAVSIRPPTATSPGAATTPGAASPPATATPTVTGPSPTPAPTATAAAATSPVPFALTGTAFRDGGAIPSSATCDGADTSPELIWSGAPQGTQALALIVTDPDARDFVHWLAFDLTGAPDGRLAAGVAASADPPRQGRNDFDRRGYGGPCPPSGEHHYRFDLFALDRPLRIGGTPGIADVRAAMQGHVLAQTRLTGTYRRR